MNVAMLHLRISLKSSTPYLNAASKDSGIITEDTTTTGTGTTPVKTAPISTRKNNNEATKAVIKYPITFLVVIFICELLAPFD
ncbi:unnamed protein product [Dicrocoelium dendriticum]|nr:unnamed protein product [Dicrocoelium dendriticum]